MWHCEESPVAFISGKQQQVEGKVHEGLSPHLLLNLSWTLLIIVPQPYDVHADPQNFMRIAFCSLCEVLSCRHCHAYSCSAEERLDALFGLIPPIHWHSLPYSLPFLPHHVWCSIILCLYLDILFVVCSPLGFYFSLTKSNVRQEKKNISLKLERKGNRSKGAPKKRQKN